jgi:hypothetical protein
MKCPDTNAGLTPRHTGAFIANALDHLVVLPDSLLPVRSKASRGWNLPTLHISYSFELQQTWTCNYYMKED